ncbi:MAG: phosphotransferase [Prevotella sp.]|nr:phosphotransferase [Prevotella sp.]
MQQLTELYRKLKGCDPETTERLPGAGSNRVYYRMTDADGQSLIGCVGTSREENHAFISLSRHFVQCGLPVPEVLAASDDELRYLQNDLGSTSLFDAIRSGREAGGNYSLEEQELLRRTIRQLPSVQFKGAQGLDFSVCYPQPEFDTQGVFFDLNYFKYCFLKATGLDFHEVKLEEDFRLLDSQLTEERCTSFLFRDFQARNVMLAGNDHQTPYFIDFQGGRRGPFYYDLASFLWQASAKYPDSLRQALIDDYYDAASQHTTLPPRSHFDRRLHLFVLFRTLQVLGAYGFRGYFERKQHFIDSIPPAIDNLRQLLSEDDAKAFPYLTDLLHRLTELPRFRKEPKPRISLIPQIKEDKHLVVRIFSFSYKKGIPQDESGNGGGYVFDCRSTHNPGRYEQYKQLTGLDEPVIRFLEDDGEIVPFLDSVYRLADFHVQRYLERGFTSLMFSFGCTGGQHRSVYCAQHLAEHLHSKFGIEVRLCHREQAICQNFGPLNIEH